MHCTPLILSLMIRSRFEIEVRVERLASINGSNRRLSSIIAHNNVVAKTAAKLVVERTVSTEYLDLL